MKKLLVLLFVAAICIPSYGSILVYGTSTTATVFDLTGNTRSVVTAEKGYLVLDINLATQAVASAQQVTYSGTGANKTQRAEVITVVFYDDVNSYIVAEYESYDYDAVLNGKTKLTDVGLGITNKKLVATSLSGHLLADLGSGIMSATLDTVRTKGANTGDGNSIATVVTGIGTYLTGKGYVAVVDTTKPEPNVMDWAAGGEPAALSDTQIRMTAHTATDANSPPVKYYFTNVTDTNHNSGWKDEAIWIDAGLTPNTDYTYNVKAKDSASVPNVTAESNDANATTDKTEDTTKPEPNVMDWAAGGEPNAISDTEITMTAATATDTQGVQYYFTCNDANHNSGWLDVTDFTDDSLTPNTNYIYTVKARDKALVPNETNSSPEANAVTFADTTPPDPCTMTFAIDPCSAGSSSITMRATTATDASGGVQYRFWYTAGATGLARDWAADANFTDEGLGENSIYGYKVQARDAGHHTGAWSAGKTAQTATSIQTQINLAKAEREGNEPWDVLITQGTYTESLDINEPNITLISASGKATTIIVSAEPNKSAIEISGQGVTIDGFTIRQGTTLAPAPVASDPLEHTVWVHADYSTIQNCTIIGAGGNQAGIFIGGRRVGPAKVGGTPIWDYNVVTGTKGHNILDNAFRYGTAAAGSGEGWGIFAVRLTDDCVISGNTFIGDANDSNSPAGNWNKDEGGPGTGIVIHSATKGSGTYAVTIEDNTAQYLKYCFLTFYACYPYNDSVGYMYDGQPESSEVNGVIVTGNTVHDLGEDVRHSGGVAIKFLGAKKSDAYDPNTADLRIGGANGVIIKNNDLHDNGCGVYIREPTSAIDSRYGCVLDANFITIDPNNSIYGNTIDGADAGYGVYNGTIEDNQDGGPVNIDAQYNWWGYASGPYYDPNNTSGAGNQVSDGVNYAHYRATAP